MNTWQPIETAPMGQPVLVTDGYSVFAGGFKRYDYDNDTFDIVFSGEDLANDDEVHMFQEELTGWQMAPATMWEPKEETFREKTERIISELSGMMGKKMRYGEMVGAPAQYCGCGPMVYENPEDSSLEQAVRVLQDMLRGEYVVENEQTADEMLAGLGYTRKNLSDADVIQYDSELCPFHIRFIGGSVYKFHDGYGRTGLTYSEILACAQMIRETEESNGTQND